MRKVYISVILLLLIALLGLPYLFGIRAEKRYNLILNEYSKYPGISITDKSYNRGWLESRAEYTFNFTGDDKTMGTISVNDNIYHGPVPLGFIKNGGMKFTPILAYIDSSVQFEISQDPDFDNFLKNIPPLDINTTITLNGGGTTKFSIPEKDSVTDEGDVIKWKGLEGKFNFSPNLQDFDSSISIAGLDIESDEILLSVKEISGAADMFYLNQLSPSPLGDFNIVIKGISATSKPGSKNQFKDFALKDINIVSSTRQNQEIINSTHTMGFEKLTIGDDNYGPGIFELAIRNIDLKGWEKLQEVVNKNQNDEPSSEQTQNMTDELMDVLPNMMNKSPEIEITKLKVQTDMGNIDGHALISIDGSNIGDHPDIASNPLFLMAAISAEVKLTASKKLLENIMTFANKEKIRDDFEELGKQPPDDAELNTLAKLETSNSLNQLLEFKILVINEDNYELSAGYSFPSLTLNGNPVPLDSLLGIGN